jgi:hypothetical protein
VEIVTVVVVVVRKSSSSSSNSSSRSGSINIKNSRNSGSTVTNQNLIQGEIKRRLNSGNACYHSVQNILSSRLLSRNVEIKLYKTIIMPVVLYV